MDGDAIETSPELGRVIITKPLSGTICSRPIVNVYIELSKEVVAVVTVELSCIEREDPAVSEPGTVVKDVVEVPEST